MDMSILDVALAKGISGEGLDEGEARKFAALPESTIYEILSISERVRREHRGDEVNLCSIINAKSGLCREDCSFCSQSARYSTGVNEYPMLAPAEILSGAAEAKRNGAREFSIVTSGTGVEKEKDVSALIEALTAMKGSVSMERCASLGILSQEVLKRLRDAGLESYHHNLETSRSFFPRVCSTHEYEDDIGVIKAAKGLGFHVCSGGIFGLGESWDDRVELAVTLKGLGVDSVPINFLNPRPGTPLEKARNLTPIECLKIIALMRLMMPGKDIVVCGGRQVNLRDLQALIFAAGANGMMIGNYLTTAGREVQEDLMMIEDLGLRARSV